MEAKSILKIAIIFAFIFSNKIEAQLDTLNYLKTFEANKANYIGKPLSFLLDNMTQIQPKRVQKTPLHGIRRFVSESAFSYNEKQPFICEDVIFFIITWNERIPYPDIEHYEKKNDFLFTIDERNFYSDKIIKDIKVHRSGNDNIDIR